MTLACQPHPRLRGHSSAEPGARLPMTAAEGGLQALRGAQTATQCLHAYPPRVQETSLGLTAGAYLQCLQRGRPLKAPPACAAGRSMQATSLGETGDAGWGHLGAGTALSGWPAGGSKGVMLGDRAGPRKGDGPRLGPCLQTLCPGKGGMSWVGLAARRPERAWSLHGAELQAASPQGSRGRVLGRWGFWAGGHGLWVC